MNNSTKLFYEIKKERQNSKLSLRKKDLFNKIMRNRISISHIQKDISRYKIDINELNIDITTYNMKFDSNDDYVDNFKKMLTSTSKDIIKYGILLMRKYSFNSNTPIDIIIKNSFHFQIMKILKTSLDDLPLIAECLRIFINFVYYNSSFPVISCFISEDNISIFNTILDQDNLLINNNIVLLFNNIFLSSDIEKSINTQKKDNLINFTSNLILKVRKVKKLHLNGIDLFIAISGCECIINDLFLSDIIEFLCNQYLSTYALKIKLNIIEGLEYIVDYHPNSISQIFQYNELIDRVTNAHTNDKLNLQHLKLINALICNEYQFYQNEDIIKQITTFIFTFIKRDITIDYMLIVKESLFIISNIIISFTFCIDEIAKYDNFKYIIRCIQQGDNEIILNGLYCLKNISLCGDINIVYRVSKENYFPFILVETMRAFAGIECFNDIIDLCIEIISIISELAQCEDSNTFLDDIDLYGGNELIYNYITTANRNYVNKIGSALRKTMNLN